MSNAQNSVDVQAVAPALARDSQDLRSGSVWRNADLSARDRSLVSLSAIIARGETVDLESQLDAALGHGVTPGEVSEAITHLAFYAGWSRALSAAAVTEHVFARHGVARRQASWRSSRT